jgi:hypothetical protein
MDYAMKLIFLIEGGSQHHSGLHSTIPWTGGASVSILGVVFLFGAFGRSPSQW